MLGRKCTILSCWRETREEKAVVFNQDCYWKVVLYILGEEQCNWINTWVFLFFYNYKLFMSELFWYILCAYFYNRCQIWTSPELINLVSESFEEKPSSATNKKLWYNFTVKLIFKKFRIERLAKVAKHVVRLSSIQRLSVLLLEYLISSWCFIQLSCTSAW